MVHTPRRRALGLIGALVASGAASAVLPASAQTASSFPSRPIKLIVPHAPGGNSDTFGRILAQKLGDRIGQQVVVENRPGAGGTLGSAMVSKSPPDGYTLVVADNGTHAIAPTLYTKLPFDAGRDFTGVSILWEVPNMLMTRLDFPANNMAEFIQVVKANPGKFSFASSGAGTSPHISGELFKSMAGVNILHVPYRGSAPAHQDILAGQVDMMFDNIPGPLGLMKGGKVKAFAVTSAKRHPAAPDTPAIAEFLPGYEITSWGGICGPAGMPPAMVDKLSGLLKTALQSEALKEAFDKQGAERIWLSPADTAKYRADIEARLAPVIKASGAKFE